jgi:hypothetical protein
LATHFQTDSILHMLCKSEGIALFSSHTAPPPFFRKNAVLSFPRQRHKWKDLLDKYLILSLFMLDMNAVKDELLLFCSCFVGNDINLRVLA